MPRDFIPTHRLRPDAGRNDFSSSTTKSAPWRSSTGNVRKTRNEGPSGVDYSIVLNPMYKLPSFVLLFANLAVAQQPLFRVVDLDIGTTERVQLPNGMGATVKLVSINETRDKVRSAIRDARVDVEINGTRATLSCGNY